MQSSRECTLRAIEFRNPDRIPICTTIDHDNEYDAEMDLRMKVLANPDIHYCFHTDPDFVPARPGLDEWGCLWKSFGATMGEVVGNPIGEWEALDGWLAVPRDFKKTSRYLAARNLRNQHPDKFLMGGLGFVMMDLINFRGYENYMTDLLLERESLDRLIDYIYACMDDIIDGYAAAGMDAVIAWEDWGLQKALMISPGLWREIYLERMARMVDRIHGHGMKYVLHSCGYILDIIEDLIAIGVDVLQLDQQRLMGLDALSRFRGRIAFFNPVDIQFASGNKDPSSVERYAREMVDLLSTEEGGFLYKTYSQPRACEIPFEVLESEIRVFGASNPSRRQERI
jgi:hypothetical protein